MPLCWSPRRPSVRRRHGQRRWYVDACERSHGTGAGLFAATGSAGCVAVVSGRGVELRARAPPPTLHVSKQGRCSAFKCPFQHQQLAHSCGMCGWHTHSPKHPPRTAPLPLISYPTGRLCAYAHDAQQFTRTRTACTSRNLPRRGAMWVVLNLCGWRLSNFGPWAMGGANSSADAWISPTARLVLV